MRISDWSSDVCSSDLLLCHGTTVATNALLEGKGAAVALVTTSGLADVIEIARQDRPSLYDSSVVRPPALVPRHRRLEVTARMAADGSELAPVDAGTLPTIPAERSEEHTSELQSLMRNSYAVFCLKKNT